MSAAAIHTFTALLLAHVLADFLFQTRWMVAHKRNPLVLVLHAALVLGLSLAALGGWSDWVLVLAGAHLASLVAVAVVAPGPWQAGAWAGLPWLLPLFALVAGLILTTRAGGFAVGELMAPYAEVDLPRGLEKGGLLIGLLERGLIFLFVLAGQPSGIGFLIAAKSILRFETASKDQRAGEYVIIGTLASFGWALALSYATLRLIDLLPPLETGPVHD
ncbi:DUF3307 domain-containing protein [Psychromarinibacter sp. C21-152]|uniref:DUF3307 domain-containing protein n=1 Tax=Psychromarinibacter sediminicola TaxID=3033385 RepID=A0AAE3NVM0_9RHOB|nr:DUF3307 domain-containing protein [Psychromarinibacter sediminicola]MDF0602952.1 DUF3307 domain-containing protein [Psychromarinibacter sediminicola]